MQHPKRAWPWILLLVGVAVGAWFVLQPAPAPERHAAHEEAEARLAAVELASIAVHPGAQLLVVGHPSSSQAERSASGDLVTYVMLYRRRQDFAGVAMDDRRGGPVEALLTLAERQAMALAKSGFQPVRAEWSTTGDEGRQPTVDPEVATPMPVSPPVHGAVHRRPTIRVADRHESDSGGGGGVTEIDLNAQGITHYRMYVVPLSGATLFVRNHFDTATTIVASEFNYADRTHLGATYAAGSYIVGRVPGHYRLHEQIVQPD